MQNYSSLAPNIPQITDYNNQLIQINNDLVADITNIYLICQQFIAANNGIFKSSDSLDVKLKALNEMTIQVKIGISNTIALQTKLDKLKADMGHFQLIIGPDDSGADEITRWAKLKEIGSALADAASKVIDIIQYFHGFQDVWEFTKVQFEFIQSVFEQWQIFLEYNPGDLATVFFPEYMDQMIPYFTNISTILKIYIDKNK